MSQSDVPPKIEALRRSQKILDRQIKARTAELEKLNESLRGEIARLNLTKESLKLRVEERTAELSKVKDALQVETTERAKADQALGDSERRYHVMADATLVLIWQSAPDKLCTYFNNGWLEFTGRTLEQELGNGWVEGVHPDDLQRCLDTYIAAFDRQEPFFMEYRLRHRSGDYRWILDRGAPLYSSGGTFLGYIGGCIDIHDRKAAEQELRAKQEELRHTLEFNQAITAHMGEGLYTLDTRGLVTYINPAAERLFGWSSTELLGRKMHDITHYRHPDGSPFPAEECPGLQVLERGTVLSNHEDVFIRKDGTFFPMIYSSSPIRSEDGGITGLVVVFRDITERWQAEKEIQRGAEWLKSLIETTQDAVVSIDRQGHIVLFNPAAERIFGYTRGEVEGRKVNVLMAEPYASEHEQYIARYEQTGEARAIGRVRTVEARRKNGEVFPIELAVAEVKTDKEIRYGAFIRDISGRRRIAEEIEARVRQQAAVAQISQCALTVADLSILFEKACELVAKTLDVELCKVLELEPDGQALRLRAGTGWKEGLVGWATVNAGVHSQAGYTLLCSKPVIVEDLRTETRFIGPPLLREHGAVSGMSVIIAGRDRPFGILGAHTVKRRTFSADDVKFLESMANVLSQAIERKQAEEALKRSQEELRAFGTRMQASREEERASLAREIHDELSGSLTALKMDLSLMPDRAAKDRGAFLEKLSSMSHLIDTTLDRVHSIVTELRPVVLDKLGLVAAIEWQAREFQERSGIGCETHLPAEDIPLHSDRATAVFRVFQEALTNAARHAGASKVVVDLRREAGTLILEVRDNGKGIDEKAIHFPKSLGLLGMRERAVYFGGTAEVSRLPEGGTVVRLRIPIESDDGSVQ